MGDYEFNTYKVKMDKDAYTVSFNIYTTVFVDADATSLDEIRTELFCQINRKLKEGISDYIDMTLQQWQKVEKKYWVLEKKK